MEYWEFLIQREGDRGWRTIETGNLQLKEGKYRIVANSDLINTQIQTRVTYQTIDQTVPQRRSQSRTQTTNPRGLLAILPFTNLDSGIWQFVCSGTTAVAVPWQRILKLRVLSLTPKPAQIDAVTEPLPPIIQSQAEMISPKTDPQTPTAQVLPTEADRFDFPVPTEPIVPISMVGEQENWADGLDRLLEQLERESLAPQPQSLAVRVPGTIHFNPIFDSPAALISLNRSTFAGIIPGNRLTISGACNLRKLEGTLIKAVKIDKLSICLRHPQTSEIVIAIEQSLPPNLDTFTFSGDLELPTAAQITLLIGEVSLYDKHNIQLASRGFTVTLSLNTLHESELSLFQLSEDRTDSTADLLAQLTAELQLESVTIGTHRSSSAGTPVPISSLNSLQAAVAVPIQSESRFTHPDIAPIEPATPHFPSPTVDVTGDLEIDFNLASFVEQHQTRNYDNLEIVIDD
jgi:hypothetical protein